MSRLPPCIITIKISWPEKICPHGLGASIADFGTRGPVFKSQLYLFFFLVKMLVLLGIEPGAFESKVSYAYP